MKKIGIVTIDSINYGNRLQNYALQQALSNLGFEVYTIPRHRPIDPIVLKICTDIKNTTRKALGTKGGLFARFNEKYIRYSSGYATADTFSPDLDKQFDFFVAGSDQVWNPIYADLPHKPVGMCDLLSFARSEQKISYAASFGVDAIPKDKIEKFRDALEDFSSISVREKVGAKIIKDLLGHDVMVVVDPTLLLSAEQWRKIARRPRIIKKSYILVYALSGRDLSLQKAINTADKDRIVDIMSVDKNGHYAPYGPLEFLYLIDHSDEVWTNSFHATVFSLLFHKPVKTFPRDGLDMSSRIVSLADIVGLGNCFTENGIFVVDNSIDYKAIDKKIDMAKQNSLDFLNNALDVESE